MKIVLALACVLTGASSAYAQAVADEDIETALTKFASEPRIDEVARWSLAEARHDPDHASALATRARLRGLVPVVRIGARRGRGYDLSAYAADETRSSVSTDDDLTLQGSATFALDRLVFAPEETTLWRESRAARAAERELVRTVVTLYFERRRMQLERELLGPRDVAHALRIREITALLNAFTGGRFLRKLVRR